VKQAFATPESLSAAIDYYRAIGSKIDRRVLAPIACAGLMIAGGKDFGGHLGPYKKSKTLFGGGAELLVIPEAGHWPHRENEPLFISKLLGFLRREAGP